MGRHVPLRPYLSRTVFTSDRTKCVPSNVTSHSTGQQDIVFWHRTKISSFEQDRGTGTAQGPSATNATDRTRPRRSGSLANMPTRLYIRAARLWLQFIAIETVSGVLRTLYLEPWLGEVLARQLGVFMGCCIFIALVHKQCRWLRIPTGRDWQVGLFWALSTFGFEVLLGKGVIKAPWSRILSDYDISHGGFMGFGLLSMAVAPALVRKLHSHHQE